MKQDGVGHICGGRARIYISALEAAGIPARYVGMFTQKEAPYDSHATVEFFYKGKWIASDPTFNVMFTKNGEYISYSELYRYLVRNEAYEVTHNGFPLAEGQAKFEGYRVPLHELMRYVVIFPVRTDADTSPKAELYPAKWDGKLTMLDKTLLPVFDPNPSYQFLGKGPLR